MATKTSVGLRTPAPKLRRLALGAGAHLKLTHGVEKTDILLLVADHVKDAIEKKRKLQLSLDELCQLLVLEGMQPESDSAKDIVKSLFQLRTREIDRLGYTAKVRHDHEFEMALALIPEEEVKSVFAGAVDGFMMSGVAAKPDISVKRDRSRSREMMLRPARELLQHQLSQSKVGLHGTIMHIQPSSDVIETSPTEFTDNDARALQELVKADGGKLKFEVIGSSWAFKEPVPKELPEMMKKALIGNLKEGQGKIQDKIYVYNEKKQTKKSDNREYTFWQYFRFLSNGAALADQGYWMQQGIVVKPENLEGDQFTFVENECRHFFRFVVKEDLEPAEREAVNKFFKPATVDFQRWDYGGDLKQEGVPDHRDRLRDVIGRPLPGAKTDYHIRTLKLGKEYEKAAAEVSCTGIGTQEDEYQLKKYEDVSCLVPVGLPSFSDNIKVSRTAWELQVKRVGVNMPKAGISNYEDLAVFELM